MIRIRPGRSWKQNPEYLAELRALGAERAKHFSPHTILDVLGLEIDGVDVAAGLREESIFPSIAILVTRLAELATGRRKRISVAIGDGPVELCIVRSGDRASLSLISLGRPARVLARDAEVRLPALLEAARTCAEELLRDLASVNPYLVESRWARSLATGAKRLARAEASRALHAPAESAAEKSAPRRTRSRGAADPGPACGFDISDDAPLVSYTGGEADLGSLLAPGQVQLRVGGSPVATHQGIPFLALRDLCRDAARIAEAWEAGEPEHRFRFGDGGKWLTCDLRAGAVNYGPRLTAACHPLELARALFSATLDFAGAASAHNPLQRENGYLRDLATTAAEGIAQVRDLAEGDRYRDKPAEAQVRVQRRPADPPLAIGKLRRLRHRESWRFDAGPLLPGGLRALGGRLIVVGTRGAWGLDATTGAPVWKLEPPARPSAVSLPEGDGPLLCAQADGMLRAVDPRTGRGVWERRSRAAQAGVLGRRHLVSTHGGRTVLVCLVEARIACAFDASSGTSVWRFAAPAATRVHFSAHGNLIFLAADNGFLYALEAATGELAWRLRTGGPPMGAPSVAGGSVAVIARRALGPALLAAQVATGRPLCDRMLDLDESGAALGGSGRVFAAGESSHGLEVHAYSGHGTQLFAALLGPGHGRAALLPLQGGALAALPDGSLCRVDPQGAIAWRNAPEKPAEHQKPSPPKVRRGVVALAGEPARLCDAESGATLGLLSPASQIEIADDLAVALADEEGPVIGYTLATHLSVVG